jgi:hypothetical protein
MPGPGLTAAALKRAVAAVQNPARAGFSERFFRTGPGEYGEGGRFPGLTVPERRRIAKTVRDLGLPELQECMAGK